MVGWPLTVDHASPRSPRPRPADGEALPSGDLDHPDNLVSACAPCNRGKWNATACADPFTGLVQPLFNPRQQLWTDHFAWTTDYLLIVGITPIARATIDQLQVNRAVYQQQRAILRAAARGGAEPWP